jgi:hypothetical protein
LGTSPVKNKAPARLMAEKHSPLERKHAAERAGDVCFDAFMRGRYSTDASHFQIAEAVAPAHDPGNGSGNRN